MNISERNREYLLLQTIFDKNQEIAQRDQEIDILRQELLKFKNIDKKTDVRKHKLPRSDNR